MLQLSVLKKQVIDNVFNVSAALTAPLTLPLKECIKPDPFPRRSGAGVKWQVNSLLSISPGLLGVLVKRVNTCVKKKPVRFFSPRPLV